MTNSVDPDQLASEESGSTLFAKIRHYPGSAELGLIFYLFLRLHENICCGSRVVGTH